MGFGDLKSDNGLSSLNLYLEDKSYIEGYVPSQSDVAIFESMSGAPDLKYVHALRWYKHVASYKSQFSCLPGVKKPLNEYGPGGEKNVVNGTADDDDDDDDMDLFGSDDEEEKEAAKQLREQRLKEYQEKKSKKPAVVAKSLIVLDVKPWDDETDLKEMERKVRGIHADGLVWGNAKIEPVAYGINKLQITCVVEDEKISTDFLEEEITGFEDLVQSMDIVAFNKL